jgi:FkbM family methyltransferase
VQVNFAGVPIVIDVDDLVGWHFMILGSFDPEVTEILSAIADGQAEQVYWDIGANKGACSYQIAFALPQAKIVALEPQLDLASMTKANLERICPGRFEVFAVGIGVKDEQLELVVPDNNKGCATLVSSNASIAGRRTTVNIVTAETIASKSNFGSPTLIKMDVEGYEPLVFESLLPIIRSGNCQAIVFENHPAEFLAFAKIANMISPLGYSIFAIKKSVFSTKLVRCARPIEGAHDYAVIRNDLAGEDTSLMRRFS